MLIPVLHANSGETVSGSIASTSSTTSSGSFTTIATTIVASTSGVRADLHDIQKDCWAHPPAPNPSQLLSLVTLSFERVVLMGPSTSSESITAALARHIELFVFLPRSPTANYCIFTTMPSSTAQGEVGSDGAKDDSQQASGNEEDE
ncbi:hypothetical protein D9758_010270 [Tetrapyrgos nigripes]|uniref:Uncharacterized protein n=1 Tax=Tetrapyrgos nigripes TaxID=182062 RepID=A0A8H5GAD2_9AGAR|nr:hypothetical protein D9758_010270 [Tetrapyrgos nigripes]